MKTVLIGTTSINRSLLHKDNIPDWYNYINALDITKYNIQWFINVDYIEKLDEPVQDTFDNFRNIITNIPIVFIDNIFLIYQCLKLASKSFLYPTNPPQRLLPL